MASRPRRVTGRVTAMSDAEQGGPYAPAPMVHDLVAKITGRYDLVARQHEADRLLAAEGAGHIVHDLPVRADGRTVGGLKPVRCEPATKFKSCF